jgi:phosphatidylglycerol:prolipoprotein diacylglycerol transferase
VRFLIEFVRADDRGGLVGVSTSQIVGVLLLGAAYYLHRRRAERVRAALEAAPA